MFDCLTETVPTPSPHLGRACKPAVPPGARCQGAGAHLDLAEVVVDALAAADDQVGRKVECDRAAQPAQRLAGGRAQALIAGRPERALQVRGERAAVDRPARARARPGQPPPPLPPAADGPGGMACMACMCTCGQPTACPCSLKACATPLPREGARV